MSDPSLSTAPALAGALLVVAALLWTCAGDLSERLIVRRAAGKATDARPRWAIAALGAARRRMRRPTHGPDIVTALETVARGLQAGLPQVAALRFGAAAVDSSALPTAVPGGGGGGDGAEVNQPGPLTLSAVLNELARCGDSGDDMTEAWQSAVQTPGLGPEDRAGLLIAARAWRLSERTGAPLAAAMAAAAAQVRAHRGRQRRVDSAREEARATIALLTALPIGGPVLALAVGVDPLVLYANPLAVICIGCGAALVLAGHRWTNALVRRALRGPELLR